MDELELGMMGEKLDEKYKTTEEFLESIGYTDEAIELVLDSCDISPEDTPSKFLTMCYPEIKSNIKSFDEFCIPDDVNEQLICINLGSDDIDEITIYNFINDDIVYEEAYEQIHRDNPCLWEGICKLDDIKFYEDYVPEYVKENYGENCVQADEGIICPEDSYISPEAVKNKINNDTYELLENFEKCIEDNDEFFGLKCDLLKYALYEIAEDEDYPENQYEFEGF